MFGIFKPRITLLDFTQAAITQIALPGLTPEMEGKLGDFDQGKVLNESERAVALRNFRYFRTFTVWYFLYKQMLDGKIPCRSEEEPGYAAGKALIRALVESGRSTDEAENETKTALSFFEPYFSLLEQQDPKGTEREIEVTFCAQFADQHFQREQDEKWSICLRLAIRYWSSTLVWLEDIAKQYRITV